MSVKAVSETDFDQEVLQSSEPVLVDFWATWCGPCRMLSPIVEEVSSEASGFRVCSVNVDEAQEIAIRYNVSAIPTLIVFRDGKEVNRSVGFIPKQQVLELVK